MIFADFFLLKDFLTYRPPPRAVRVRIKVDGVDFFELHTFNSLKIRLK